ncbi:MAG: hypothetical protein DRR08_12435 [Candidatus Parabeggiatoa sp. nov. 2]|nr:MAG: hypothetical protein B6247_07865 [Beggiatoa sp. 4572_84]RKZ59987.1 MAG: hypothetical protein DRR08_12435 [Gammaproteobacteria bacterium]
MWKDPIIDELHQIRQEHAKKFNNDFKAIFEDLKKQEENSPIKIISTPFKQKKLPTLQPRA